MQPLLEGVAESPDRSENSAGIVQPPVPLLDRFRSLWPEWITLSLYTALVALAIPYHEPFADEAQAWQLARSLSLPVLFEKYIRYEGSPGLWHFLLWILIRIHVSYSGLHWLCGATAVVATSLLIFRSPFPRYLKFTLPFTYFLLFQYAVVARNYVLVPLLLYGVALCWKRRPVLVALLLGLLANVALHAAMISGGLAIVYFFVWIREGYAEKPDFRRELLPSAALLLVFYALAIWTAWPASDLQISRALGGHIYSFFLGFWRRTPNPQILQAAGAPHSFFIYAIASLLTGICQPWILAIPFWIAFALCLTARRCFLYLLPVLFFAIFSGAACANFWHMGLLMPLIVCLLWITWPAPSLKTSGYEITGRVAVLLLAGVQILWSAYAIGYDHSHAFSPDPAAAKFLKPFVQNGGTIGLTFLSNPADHSFPDDPQDHDYISVGLLPYFDHNIFANQPYPFWWWSAKNPTENRFPAELASRPRIILVEVVQSSPKPINLDNPKVKLLNEDGYQLTNTFCGTMPIRLKPEMTLCHLIFQHSETAQ
jgi:hypothetical protein